MLKRSKRDNKTLFIDASAEFVHGGNKNKLTEANRARILEAFTGRKDVAHFARLVENGDIAATGYNIARTASIDAASLPAAAATAIRRRSLWFCGGSARSRSTPAINSPIGRSCSEKSEFDRGHDIARTG